MKPVLFLGDSLRRLRGFPPDARQAAGYQIDRVQRGLRPDDCKPMPTIGPGVEEIRIRDEAGAFRVIFTARRHDSVVVLHAFQKKSHRTSRCDIDIAVARLKELSRDRP